MNEVNNKFILFLSYAIKNIESRKEKITEKKKKNQLIAIYTAAPEQRKQAKNITERNQQTL